LYEQQSSAIVCMHLIGGRGVVVRVDANGTNLVVVHQNDSGFVFVLAVVRTRKHGRAQVGEVVGEAKAGHLVGSDHVRETFSFPKQIMNKN